MVTDAVGIPIQNFGLCSITGLARQRLCKIAKMHELAADEVLFREGEAAKGVYIVCAGGVKLTQHGRPADAFELGCSSEVLGVAGLLYGPCYHFTATALVSTQVAFIAREDFLAFIGEYPHAVESLSSLRQYPHTIVPSKGVWVS